MQVVLHLLRERHFAEVPECRLALGKLPGVVASPAEYGAARHDQNRDDGPPEPGQTSTTVMSGLTTKT